MKLHTLLTPSHQVLYERYFRPSFKDDFELCVCEQPQVGPEERHVYGSKEFNVLARRKVEFLIEAIHNNWGSVFLFSDVDIVFFQPVVRDLAQRMRSVDFVAQRNSVSGKLNSGFWALRANDRTLKLWQRVREMMQADLDLNDQTALNQLLLGHEYWDSESRLCRWACEDLSSLQTDGPVYFAKKARARLAHFVAAMKTAIIPRVRRNDFGLRWTYLPDTYFCPGLHAPRVWADGIARLKVPRNITLYHANWTRGVANKRVHLEYVMRTVGA